MNTHFNWKSGVIVGIMAVVVGFAFFLTLGTTVDAKCQTGVTKTTGCSLYHGWNTGVQAYSDIWRSIFARRCVGGNGPDDCIAPDTMIMASTLFALGFVAGGFLRRRKSTPTLTTPTTMP